MLPDPAFNEEYVHVVVTELLLGGIMNALREEHAYWVRLCVDRVATNSCGA